MSGLGLSLSSRRRRSDFDPATVSAVSAWLRVANATSSGGLISSLPDMLNSNPAVQATDANKPATGTSANSLPIMTSTAAKFMNWPVHASNNGTTQFGYGMWIKATSTTGSRGLADTSALSGGASANKFRSFGVTGGNQFSVRVYNATSTAGRSATLASGFGTLNTWQFVTVELDLDSGGAEASRCVVTIDGVVQTLNFADLLGTPGSMPASMAAPTGSMILLAIANNGTAGWVGDIGPNIFFFGSAMAGRTEGLLTSAARTALRNFEAPT